MEKRAIDFPAYADVRWPCDLCASFKAELGQALVFRQLEAGSLVADLGSFLHGLNYMADGVLIHAWLPDDGTLARGFVYGSGDWLGWGQLFERHPALLSHLEVVETTLLFHLPQVRARALAAHQPELYKLAFHVAQERWQQALQGLYFNGRGDCIHNVAYALMEAARRRPQPPSGPPVVTLAQQQLAVVAGFSRQRVNGALQELAAAGAITIGRNRIELISRATLARHLNPSLLVLDDPTRPPTHHQGW